MAEAVQGGDMELSESWVDGRSELRWRSTVATGPGTGAAASGSSILEVDPGCALPRHTDSAEETIVVVQGTAEVTIRDTAAIASGGDVVLVPADVPHQVRNVGDRAMRFVAVYAGTDVVTRYEHEVQPAGSDVRRPVE
jgi:quercetin dioxygenase-like cupin family protein